MLEGKQGIINISRRLCTDLDFLGSLCQYVLSLTKLSLQTYPTPPRARPHAPWLAEEYHQRTEEYDRTVCTGQIIRDSIMPGDSYELSLINRHALSVKRELEERAMREHGISKEGVNKAIKNSRF